MPFSSLSVAVLSLGLVAATACTPVRPSPVEDGAGTVVAVIDGDTAIVDVGGAEEPVRLIGIDTPEVAHPDEPAECFGPEAAARTLELLPPGTVVRLERDLEARDRYDRLLAYVHRAADDLFVNETLVREGYADTLVFEPNTSHEGDLGRARAEARTAGRGLWGRCPA